jgi:short-subunit dehydrogenase
MELQSKGSAVSISTICPGFIKTEITAGGGLGRDGKPVGTSMDPAANKKAGKKSAGGGVAMISAAACAEQVIAAAAARRHTTIVPKYPYSIIYNVRKFFPELVDKLLIRMYAPPPRRKPGHGPDASDK